MSHRTMEAHYRPNWELTQAHGLNAYNCGYAETPGVGTFDEHQQALVWRLLGDVDIRPDSTVLDVGCGIGGPIGWMAERYRPRRAIGLEYCQSSAQAAEERYRHQEHRPSFLQGDAHCLPLADESVDVIFNLESALHYANKQAFLSECRRVLRPGGTLCLGDITTRTKVMFAPIQWLNLLPVQFNCNIHLWSDEDYLEAFEANGLQVLRHEEASRSVAHALLDGLREMARISWLSSSGFRRRRLLLAILQHRFQAAELTYDLFAVRKS